MATKQTPQDQGRKGWQPIPHKVPDGPEPRGGYQPTTGEQKPVKPPPKTL